MRNLINNNNNRIIFVNITYEYEKVPTDLLLYIVD